MFDFIIGQKTLQIIIPALIIALIIVVLVLIAKYPALRKVLGVLLGSVVIISGFFSAININKYYNTNGGIIGKLGDIFNPNQVEVEPTNLEFNFSNIMLTKDENEKYSAKFETNDTLTLSEEQKYCILVNDEPCQLLNYEHDFIIAHYSYVFFNETFEENLTDTLEIRFAFSKAFSSLKVETSGGQDAVNLWNSFFNKNKFVITIIPTNNVYVPTEITKTAFLVRYVERVFDNFGAFQEDRLIKTEYLTLGDSLWAPTSAELGLENGLEFVCWLDNPAPFNYSGRMLPPGCTEVSKCSGEMTVYCYTKFAGSFA